MISKVLYIQDISTHQILVVDFIMFLFNQLKDLIIKIH
jgi:hypothetical protein